MYKITFGVHKCNKTLKSRKKKVEPLLCRDEQKIVQKSLCPAAAECLLANCPLTFPCATPALLTTTQSLNYLLFHFLQEATALGATLLALQQIYCFSSYPDVTTRLLCATCPRNKVLCFCWLLFFSFVLHRDNPLRFPSIIPSKRLSVLCGSAGRRPKSGINGERYSRPIFLLHGPYSKIFFLPPRKSEILFRVNLEITGTTRSTCRI